MQAKVFVKTNHAKSICFIWLSPCVSSEQYPPTSQQKQIGTHQIRAGQLPATNRKGYEMSYAKPQDGSTVKGYRTLGPKEVGDMNELKQATREFNALLEKQKSWVADELAMTGNHSDEAHEAGRCLAIARTKMQEACMWACRAVARPDADC